MSYIYFSFPTTWYERNIERMCSFFHYNKTQLTTCNCIPQVQCYDPETDSWLLRANIPIAKRCITAVSLNNLVYVCGGLTKSIFCYDPAEDYWIHVVHTFNKQVIDNTEHLRNKQFEEFWVCIL